VGVGEEGKEMSLLCIWFEGSGECSCLVEMQGVEGGGGGAEG
jgi:hypothetical protein